MPRCPAGEHPAGMVASMGDFYGIKPGTIPGFAEAGGGRFMSVADLPGDTVRNMAMFTDKLRGMHEIDPRTRAPRLPKIGIGLMTRPNGFQERP
jgi:hypothetical protein